MSFLSSAGEILPEAERREDFGDPDFVGMRLIAGFDPQRVAQRLADAHVFALTEPLLDLRFPNVCFEPQFLFGSGKRFQFRRFEPPFCTSVIPMDGFSP